MKKSPLITIVSIAALLFIAGCKKEETKGTNPSATTITGTVYANLNVTTADDRAPDGTKIVILINPNDLLANPDTSKKYDSYRYPTSVVGGSYSVQVPALNKGTKVKIVMDEFIANQTQSDGTTPRKVYTPFYYPFDGFTITVNAGLTKVQDLSYNDN